jgi:hypothetical protein
MALTHQPEQAGDQPAADGSDAAQAHLPGDLVEHRGHVGPERVELAAHPAGPLDHHLTLLGEGAAVAVDQYRPQFTLEPGDVGGDVGLDGVERARRGRERSFVGDGHEGGELAEVHRFGRYYLLVMTI